MLFVNEKIGQSGVFSNWTYVGSSLMQIDAQGNHYYGYVEMTPPSQCKWDAHWAVIGWQ